MATKPTRAQEHACDLLALALNQIAEAARRDGKTPFGPQELNEVARSLARASSAFDLDTIVTRAVVQRARGMELSTGTAEMLTLWESPTTPLEMLLLADDDLRELVARMEEELGEI